MKKLIEIISKIKYADYLLITYLLMIIYMGYNTTYLLDIIDVLMFIISPIIAIRLLMILKFIKKNKIITIILNILITVIFIIIFLLYSTILILRQDERPKQREKIPYSERVANYEKTIKGYDGKEIFKYFPKEIPEAANDISFNISNKDSINYLKLDINKKDIDKIIEENEKYIFWKNNANVICNNFKICKKLDIYDIDSMYVLKGDEKYPKYLTGFSVSREKDNITFFSTRELYLNKDPRDNAFAPSRNYYQYVIQFLLDEARDYYYQLIPKSIPQNAQNYWFEYTNGENGRIIIVRFNIDEQYINNIIRKNRTLLLPKEELDNQINKGIFLPDSNNYKDYIIYYMKKDEKHSIPTAGIIVSKKNDEIIFFVTSSNTLKRIKNKIGR